LTARTAAFATATAVVAVLGVELAMRVVISIASGESKFGYGFGSADPQQKPGMLFPQRDDPARWHAVMRADDREKTFLEHETGVYSRYAPGQRKRNRDEYGHLNEIRINNLGFRGEDVAAEKPEGTFRVITLGASSTFGYRNRDAETYPHFLQVRLNALRGQRDCAGVARFDVVNFGIPHLNAASLHALLVAEGLALDPDLVTLYAGANETRLIEAGWVQRTVSALGDRLLTARFVRSLLRDALASFDADELSEHLSGIGEGFVTQLDAIAAACEQSGVPLLVASQQAKSFSVEPERMSEVSYAQEVSLVRAQLTAVGHIDLKQLVFLMQASLMADLRAWASQRDPAQVGFVDVIAAVEAAGARDGLLSWVHLSARANRSVANALADPIFERACSAR
jgi:hypothetical protein